MKFLFRYCLAILAVVALCAPANASFALTALAGRLQAQQLSSTVGTITAVNSGSTVGTLTANSFVKIATTAPSSALTITVSGGSGPLWVYFSGDGSQLIRIPDANVLNLAGGTGITTNSSWGVSVGAGYTVIAGGTGFTGTAVVSITGGPGGGGAPGGGSSGTISSPVNSNGDSSGVIVNGNTKQVIYSITGSQTSNAIIPESSPTVENATTTLGYTVANVTVISPGVGGSGFTMLDSQDGTTFANPLYPIRLDSIQNAVSTSAKMAGTAGARYALGIGMGHVQFQLPTGLTSGTLTIKVTYTQGTVVPYVGVMGTSGENGLPPNPLLTAGQYNVTPRNVTDGMQTAPAMSSHSTTLVTPGPEGFPVSAGTNLNTSLLALESGGNLATAVTKLNSILTDLNAVLNGTNLNTAPLLTYNSSLPTYTTGQTQNGYQGAIDGALINNPEALNFATDSITAYAAATAGLPVTQGYVASSSFSVSAASATTAIDSAQYGGISVQVSTAQSGATVGFQGSNDNSTWVNVTGFGTAVSGGSAVAANGTTTAGIWVLSRNYRYFRLNLTGSWSGNVVGTITLFANAPVPHYTDVVTEAGSQTGLAASNSNGALAFGPLAGITSASTQIKSGGGSFYGYELYNPLPSTVVEICIYNTATPSFGVSTPLIKIFLAGGEHSHIQLPIPVNFGTALYEITSTAFDYAGTTITAPSTLPQGTIWYD